MNLTAGTKPILSFEIRKKYTISCYILFFFTFSMVGWLWEVGLHLVQTGELVNRGVLLGPWLPIYGSGGVLVLLLLKPIFEKPILVFFSSMILCSAIEYFTSWFLEVTKGQRWWDYSGYFLNINGRICLEGAVVFGIGCCAVVYLLAPTLARVYERLPGKPTLLLCAVLVAGFGTDVVWSHFHPNEGNGVTEGGAAWIETTGGFRLSKQSLFGLGRGDALPGTYFCLATKVPKTP
ncbi:MAG: hypothetical protein EOM52_00815 [Clostridia bacterium]|nr:hypothetical protein [Clostridia bacterium]